MCVCVLSVGSVHGVDVAVHLVSEGEPGLVGEVDLSAAGAVALALAAPGGRGGQARLQVLAGHYGDRGQDRSKGQLI